MGAARVFVRGLAFRVGGSCSGSKGSRVLNFRIMDLDWLTGAVAVNLEVRVRLRMQRTLGVELSRVPEQTFIHFRARS